MKSDALIKKEEACRLTAYPDPATRADPWTIGWGCTGKMADGRVIAKGLTITQADADAELDHRLAPLEAWLRGLVHVPVNSNQWAALCSLAWNVPPEPLSKSRLLRRLNAGDYAGAAQCFQAWDLADGKVNAELVGRRHREMLVFNQAEAPSVT